MGSSNNFESLDPILHGNWSFKISKLNGQLMLIIWNKLFNYSHIKFFRKETDCRDWIELLILQEQLSEDK